MIIWPRLLFGLSVARREIIYRLLKSPGAPLIVRSVKPANLGVGRAATEEPASIVTLADVEDT